MSVNLSSLYYDKTQMLSYDAFYNFIISNRGGGKTYCLKKWGIDDAYNNGKLFMWVRRYGTELDVAISQFFKDIKDRYPNMTFTHKVIDHLGHLYLNDKLIGYYCALSKGITSKSASFADVDKIIFDEFLILGNTYHYLKDEVDLMLELTETVFRTRDIIYDKVKAMIERGEATEEDLPLRPRGVYFIGNNITIANPYFLNFKIMPKQSQRFTHYKDKDILVEFYKNSEFIEEKKTSRIGKLTAGTKYFKYAIENEAYQDNDDFLAKKPANTKFYCAIYYHNKYYGFWMDWKNGRIYCNYQYDPSSYNIYSLSRDDHTLNTMLIASKNQTYIKNLINYYASGCMFFENQQIKNQIYEILAYFFK